VAVRNKRMGNVSGAPQANKPCRKAPGGIIRGKSVEVKKDELKGPLNSGKECPVSQRKYKKGALGERDPGPLKSKAEERCAE